MLSFYIWIAGIASAVIVQARLWQKEEKSEDTGVDDLPE